ncbi:MAG: F0F1 ATP synthase subunit gamma [Holosporales bacterium]|jgi:F-type H+-transporting ATPase subunit gamma|nr:F0F1 ATP synthase subunit gamma [Holosporales bacterium]
MESLLAIRNRIATIDSLIKATNAMKIVSTAKLSRLNNLNKFSMDCAKILFEMLSFLLGDLLFSHSLETNHYLFPNPNGKRLVLIFSADQGFCGNFNHSIIAEAKKIVSLDNNDIIKIFGKKAASISKNNLVQIKNKSSIDAFSREVGQIILEHLQNHDISEIVVISSRFKNILSQEAKSTVIFPFPIKTGFVQYIETDNDDKRELLEDLFRAYMNKLFISIITEHSVSEFSARVISMDNSVKNAKDMSKDLGIMYNKMHQAKITKELIEIVASIESAV